jgi:hypothetical protein
MMNRAAKFKRNAAMHKIHVEAVIIVGGRTLPSSLAAVVASAGMIAMRPSTSSE